jgi:hypothetical protein
MKMRSVVLLLLLFTQASPLLAQVSQPSRYEREFKASDADFTAISLEQEGLALFRETDKYKSGSHSWQLMVLDTALQQKMDTLIAIDREYSFIGHEYVKGKLVLLYQSGEFARNKVIHCAVDLSRFEVTLTSIKTELDLRLTHFSSLNKGVLFGGYISQEPAIVMYDLVKEHVQMVPGFLQRNTELLDVRVNENNTFNVIMAEKISNDNKRLIFRTFDSQAKLLLEDIITVPDARSILTAISSSLHREDLMVIGTWGMRNSNRANGFYVTQINPFEEQDLTLTSFGSLQRYLDYLKPRKAQKVKAKTKSALASGKTYEFTNNVLPYKIIEHDKGYLVLAETYSPVSTSSSNNVPNNQQNWNNPYYHPYYNPYYNTYPTSRLYRPITYTDNVSNEDQIKTYSSSLLSINAKGEIENDYSVKLDDIKIPSVSQVTDVSYYSGNAVLVYRKESKVLYKKIIQLSDDVEEGEAILQQKDTFDEVRNEEEDLTGIRHWYNNNFYTWGYQTIRNINLTGDKTREVFYINKVVVR